ncbi:MAG: hypothetical protein JRJ13_14105 [Deltaproteobacteria bacterium]|nr:hypothetical protein [Deltaproteobacteria bacterium]
MSDTCYLHITFPRKDLPKFNEVLKDELYDGVFWDEEMGDEHQVDAIIYEANYGWYDQVQALARAGLTFSVSHGAGAEYGPCVYACYKGELVMCSADWDGNPVIAIPRSGGVPIDDYLHCKRYWELVSRIEAETKRKAA